NKRHALSIRSHFTFQNLANVNRLYAGALNAPLDGYGQYALIRLLVARRHVFTHRGGFVDQKYLEQHNTYLATQGSAASMLSQDAIGKLLVVDRPGIRSLAEQFQLFVAYVEAQFT